MASVPTKRVIINGCYGVGNWGDEAIAVATDKILKDLKSDIDLTVWPQYPLPYSSHLGVHNFKYALSNLKRYAQLKSSNAYLLGGGGLLKDYGPNSLSLKLWLEWLMIAQKLRVKTALWSIGVEKIRFEESKRLLKDSLSAIDTIIVRDLDSKKELELLGIKDKVRVTSDPVIYLTKNLCSNRRLKSRRLRIGVSLRHWFSDGFYTNDTGVNAQVLSHIAEFLKRVIDEYDANILLIPFRSIKYDNDLEILQGLSSRIGLPRKVEMFPSVMSIDEMIDCFNKLDFVFGMRLHSLILGASLGLPVLGLSYMPKVAGFMKSIQQEKSCVEYAEINKDLLWNKFTNIISSYESISEDIVKNITQSRLSLMNNVEILSEMVV